MLPGLYGGESLWAHRGLPLRQALALGPAALPPPAYLHVFHPGENSWRPLTEELPQEAPLRGCGLCTLHNYLFLAGASAAPALGRLLQRGVLHNPLAGVWRPGAALHSRRAPSSS